MCTDAELTEMCRVIFGDIVSRAYRTPYYVDNDYTIAVKLKNNTLEYDSEQFIIEFINGAIVQFTNSEWASLERINK